MPCSEAGSPHDDSERAGEEILPLQFSGEAIYLLVLGFSPLEYCKGQEWHKCSNRRNRRYI